MEISVALDKRTGKTQVISTASITPEIIQEKGLKVYEDGHKSVYALPPGGAAGEVAEMTPMDVEELLRQATDWSGDVQYHQPVYAAPFTGTSRPLTPRTSSKTTSPSLVHSKRIGNPNPASSRSESKLEVYPEIEELTFNSDVNTHLISRSNLPNSILGFIKTNAATLPVCKNMESNPQEAPRRYDLDLFEKSMNINTTSLFFDSTTDNFGQSETPSLTFSRSKLGIEEYRKESDTKNTDQTLHHINNFSYLVSEEICTPIQPFYDDHETSSLMTTHRYEMELINRSMNKYGTSPTNITNQNEMLIGKSGNELVKDMTSALTSTSGGLPTLTEPFHKNMETSHLLSTQSKTPSPALSDSEVKSNQIQDNMTRQNINNQKAALVSVRASSDGIPNQPMYKNIETSPPSPQRYTLDTIESKLDRNSPTYTDSLSNSLFEELDPEAVTMVFMGFENVDEDEEDAIHAELVVIGNSDEEDGNEEKSLSIYHPNGYTSKVFQPVVGVAKVTPGRDFCEEQQWGEPHKPTFRHTAGKSPLCQENVRLQGSDDENVGKYVTER